jgi:transcriptional regulator with XRE-family HTH domain
MKTTSMILAELRIQKKISQQQLAELAGITQTHLDKIEKGLSKPTTPMVFKICKALGFDPLALADLLSVEFKTHIEANYQKSFEAA